MNRQISTSKKMQGVARTLVFSILLGLAQPREFDNETAVADITERFNTNLADRKLNLNSLLKSMQNCSLTFFRDANFDPVDFSTVQTPFQIRTGDYHQQTHPPNNGGSSSDSDASKMKSCSYSFIQNRNMTSDSFETRLQNLSSNNATFVVMAPLVNEANIRNKSKTASYAERFYFLYGNDSESLEFKKSYYKCTICDVGGVVKEVICSNGSSCFQGLMAAKVEATQNGSGIIWETGDISKGLLDFKTSSNKRGKSFFDLRSTKWESVAEFLTETWNVTDAQRALKKERLEEPRKQTPFFGTTTYWHPTDAGLRFSAFVLGLKPSFKFITSDSVVSHQSGFTVLTNPMEGSAWYFLIGLAVLASTAFTAMTYMEQVLYPRHVSGSEFMKSFLWIGGVLLEQCNRSAPFIPKNARLRYGVMFMFGLWLLVAIIITNGYKSALKSHMTTVVQIEFRWERLEEIANFTIFLPFKKGIGEGTLAAGQILEWVKILKAKDSDRKSADPCMDHIRNKYQEPQRPGTANWKMREEYCGFAEELLHLKDYIKKMSTLQDGDKTGDTGSNQPRRQILPSFQHGFDKIMFFYEEDLEEVLVKDLSQSRTAFITEENKVKEHIRRFYSISRNRHDHGMNLNWHSNTGTNDGALARMEILFVTDKNDPMYQVVPNRVKVLLQSGIYWLWERWYNNQLYRVKGVVKKKAFPKPLALLDTGLYLVLQVFLVGLALSSLKFLAEVF